MSRAGAPATEAQKAYAESLGVRITNSTTRAQASALITEALELPENDLEMDEGRHPYDLD